MKIDALPRLKNILMFVVCPTLAGYNPKLHHLEVYFVNGFILTNIERTSARFILGDRRPMEGIKRKIVKMTLGNSVQGPYLPKKKGRSVIQKINWKNTATLSGLATRRLYLKKKWKKDTKQAFSPPCRNWPTCNHMSWSPPKLFLKRFTVWLCQCAAEEAS